MRRFSKSIPKLIPNQNSQAVKKGVALQHEKSQEGDTQALNAGRSATGQTIMHLSMLSPTYPLPGVVGEMVGI